MPAVEIPSAVEPLSEDDDLSRAAKDFANGDATLDLLLARLLTLGGDERLTIEDNFMNKYSTQPRPCDEGISRGSCTSNVPTKEAFQRGLDLLRRLLLKCQNMRSMRGKPMLYRTPKELFDWLLDDVRERLRNVFHLSMDDCISLFPSGTDAELLPALMAIARCLAQKNRSRLPSSAQGSESVGPPTRVLSIVTAAGEVGSGTLNAACGKHFSNLLPSGQRRPTSNQVFGIPNTMVFTQEVWLRDDAGKPRPTAELDEEIETIVQTALHRTTDEDGTTDVSNEVGCVVVHMVVGSKTGRTIPSIKCFQHLVAKYGDRVLPVVDACQGRIGEWTVRSHLDQGHVVLTTGSKFFGGPPFSGVCLTSGQLTSELERNLSDMRVSHVLKTGALHEYLIASLLSSDMPNLRSLLPEVPLNVGLLFRWTLALFGMEAYFTDMSAREREAILSSWTEAVHDLAKTASPDFVKPIHEPAAVKPAQGFDSETLAGLSSIICFECHCRSEGISGSEQPPATSRALGMEDLRLVQRLMATDLSEIPGLVPEKAVENAAKVVATRCFMGQPVSLGPSSSVLRVAASAPLVLDIHKASLGKALAEDEILFKKLAYILENWHLLGGHAEKTTGRL